MRRRAKQTLMRETVKRRVGRVRKMRLKARKWREEEETEEEWVINKYKVRCRARKMIAEESKDKRRSRLAVQARRMRQRLLNETEEDCHKKIARWEWSRKDHSLIHVDDYSASCKKMNVSPI